MKNILMIVMLMMFSVACSHGGKHSSRFPAQSGGDGQSAHDACKDKEDVASYDACYIAEIKKSQRETSSAESENSADNDVDSREAQPAATDDCRDTPTDEAYRACLDKQ